jgi:ABC-type sugar transport system permease subunit
MFGIKSVQRKANWVGWGLMLPTVLSILAFIVYPVVFSAVLSFTNWKFVFHNIEFVGWDNYKWLFSEQGIQFWKSTLISIEFTFISTAIQTFLGFLLAYVLYNMGRRSQGIYKVLLYVPVLLPASVVSVMWTFIFEPNVGLMDVILSKFGVTKFPLWLTDQTISLGTVIAVNTWRYIGVTMIIYFIAMNSIPKDIIEGAIIDGAGKARILWKFILPLTWSSTATNLLLSVMGGLKSFDLFYLFTGGTGDYGGYGVGLYIWRTAYAFKTFCRAVTMSLVLSGVIAAITLGMNFLLDKQEARIDG